MNIHAVNVSKRFGAFHALRGVSLEVKEGELVALLLQANNFKTGKTDLQNNQPALDQIKIAPKK